MEGTRKYAGKRMYFFLCNLGYCNNYTLNVLSMAAPRELYPAWRWCEKMDAVEEAKQKHGLKPDLPDFYNLILERPREDARGYSLLYVDVRSA